MPGQKKAPVAVSAPTLITDARRHIA